MVTGELVSTNKIVKRMDTEYIRTCKSAISMVGLIARAKDEGAAEDEGYKNIYDLCKQRYGMSQGTVGNSMKIFKTFFDPETYQILDEYAGYTQAQLLAMLPSRKKAVAEESSDAVAEESYIVTPASEADEEFSDFMDEIHNILVRAYDTDVKRSGDTFKIGRFTIIVKGDGDNE